MTLDIMYKCRNPFIKQPLDLEYEHMCTHMHTQSES
jgi:hypothetical protein